MAPRFGFGQFGVGEGRVGRILLLDGPARLLGQNYQRLSSVRIGQPVRAQFEGDLAVDVEAVERLRPGRHHMD
jgi:bacterioferritin